MSETPPKFFLRARREMPVAVPPAWLRAAAKEPGKTLAVGLALWTQARACNAGSFAVRADLQRAFGVAPDAMYEGLARLAAAQLIMVSRGRGRPARVTLLDPRGMTVQSSSFPLG